MLCLLLSLIGNTMASLSDNTLLTANDLGILSGALEISDTFDATDRIAYYRFTLAQNSDLAGLFSEATSLTDVLVISDRNANGIVEGNEVVARTSGSSTGGSNSFFQPLPAGTYFIEVSTELRRTEPYTLRLTETSKPGNVFPDPGNSLAQALDLGILSGQRSLRDYVGRLDEIDFYKFTLTQDSNLGIVASGQTSDTRVQIISDRNANGIVDSGEVVEGFNFGFFNNDSFSATLSAGTYFILVGRNVSSANSTQYALALTQVADLRGDDTLRGTPRRDNIRGLGGNDRISGFGESDRLFGNAGNDQLFGGGGSDRLAGNGGNDILLGGGGRDTLLGGGGGDILDGGSGRDLIVTGGGRDRIVLQRGRGFDRVTDFRNNQDKIDLVGISYGQLNFRQRGSDVLIKIGNANAMLLENTNLRFINQADFV